MELDLYRSLPSDAVPLAQFDVAAITPSQVRVIPIPGSEGSPVQASWVYEDVYRTIVSVVDSLTQLNVVRNPDLRYPDPNNIGLQDLPPYWSLESHSQTDPTKLRWYVHRFPLDSQNRAIYEDLHEKLDDPSSRVSGTLLFPCGYWFRPEFWDQSPSGVSCRLYTDTLSVDLNRPYVLELLVFSDPYFAIPPSNKPVPTGFWDTMRNGWWQNGLIGVQVAGLDSNGTIVQTFPELNLTHRATGSEPGHSRRIFRAYELSGELSWSWMAGRRLYRWVVDSNIVFTNSAVSSARVWVRVIGLPHIAIVAMLMYPLDRYLAFACRQTDTHYQWFKRPQLVYNSGLMVRRFYQDYQHSEIWEDKPTGVDLPYSPLVLPDTRSLGFAPAAMNAEWMYYHTLRWGRVYPAVSLWWFSRPPKGTDPQLDANTQITHSNSQRLGYLSVDSQSEPPSDVLSCPYTGGWVTLPLAIAKGGEQVTYQAPSDRPYARFHEVLSAEMPVRTNVPYGIRIGLSLHALWNYEWLMDDASGQSPWSSAPYWDRSALGVAVAVFGYDRNGDLTETAFLSTPDLRELLSGITLRPDDAALKNYHVAPVDPMYLRPSDEDMFPGVPTLAYPNWYFPSGYFLFTDPNTVKARIGLILLQRYVRPTSGIRITNDKWNGFTDQTPPLLLPPPIEALRIEHWMIYPLWPDTYTIGWTGILDAAREEFQSGWDVDGFVVSSGSEYAGNTGYIELSGTRATGTASTQVSVSGLSPQVRYWVRFRARVYIGTTSGSESQIDLRLSWLKGSRLVWASRARIFRDGSDWQSLGSGWYQIDAPVPVDPFSFRSAGDVPDTLKVQVFGSLDGTTSNTLRIGALNVGVYPDPSGSVVLERTSIGKVRKLNVSLPDVPPRVERVVAVTERHWGLVLRPGISYRWISVPNDSPNGWLSRAGFSAGESVVAVYSLPEYQYLRGSGSPFRWVVEQRFANRGLIHVDYPLNPDQRTYLQIGDTVISGLGRDGDVVRFGAFSRQIQITHPGFAGYTGPVLLIYPAIVQDHIYTGFRLRLPTGQYTVVPFNIAPGGGSTCGQYPAPPFNFDQVEMFDSMRAGLSGVTIYLLPCRAVRLSDWNDGERRGLRLPADTQGELEGYLRHHIGHLGHPLPYPEALPIAHIVTLPALGWASFDLSDLRGFGGGAREFDPALRYWDRGSWDDLKEPGGGRVVVRLPRALLQPTAERDAFTHDQVLEIVKRYLPAGLAVEVEYVD